MTIRRRAKSSPPAVAGPEFRPGGVRPAAVGTDVWPAGERGPDDRQSLILDAIVAALSPIPGLFDCRWMTLESVSGFDPDGYPSILVLRHGSRPFDQTMTSELIALRATLRLYVRGDEPRPLDLEILRIEEAMRAALVDNSLGGLVCGPLTDLTSAGPVAPEGGEEDIRAYHYDLYTAYMRVYGAP